MSIATSTTTASIFEAAGLTTKTTEKKSTELGIDDFYTLMIAQLKNQDPTDPVDNNEFLSEIAQFGTVSGIETLNETVTDLSTSLTSNQAIQAGTLVGKEVLVPSSTGWLSSGSTLRGVATLDASAGDVVLHVYNAGGALVRDLHLGSQKAGDVAFAWDGLTNAGTYAPSGTYTVVAEASANNKTHTLDTSVYGRVNSVNVGDEAGLTLDLDGLGTVAFSNVKEIH
jgi:flagellar basal-body rod modification protein FlgD